MLCPPDTLIQSKSLNLCTRGLLKGTVVNGSVLSFDTIFFFFYLAFIFQRLFLTDVDRHNRSLCARPGMLKQMEEDKCRFGPAAWASAAPRLEKLRFLLAKETLQHMRATEMCLNRKKASIRERVCVSRCAFLKLL